MFPDWRHIYSCFLFFMAVLSWHEPFVEGNSSDLVVFSLILLLWKINMKNCGRTCSQSLVFICFVFFISSQVLPAGE